MEIRSLPFRDTVMCTMYKRCFFFGGGGVGINILAEEERVTGLVFHCVHNQDLYCIAKGFWLKI